MPSNQVRKHTGNEGNSNNFRGNYARLYLSIDFRTAESYRQK